MIRPYAEEDVDRVIEIWEAASRGATPFLSDTFLAREAREIREAWIPAAETWVYEDGGVVAGFIALLDHEVGGIFVDPAAQGRGIGRALMDHAASTRSHLILDVFQANRIARRFYDRYGFVEVSRHVDEGSGEPQIRMAYGASTGPPRAS